MLQTSIRQTNIRRPSDQEEGVNMANAREILSRMKSVQDTRKITNAMYLISSTKLKKSKKLLEETEPYFYSLQDLDVYKRQEQSYVILCMRADTGPETQLLLC